MSSQPCRSFDYKVKRTPATHLVVLRAAGVAGQRRQNGKAVVADSLILVWLKHGTYTHSIT